MKKIIQNHEGCIGCGTCIALCPEHWVWGKDGKAVLKGGQKNKRGELELKVKDEKCSKEAAESCPVQVIRIQNYK